MFRRTKIVATVGPASSSEEMLKELIMSGANVFRLNFSHGDHADKRAIIQRIRSVSEQLAKPIAILGDLQGPKNPRCPVKRWRHAPDSRPAGDHYQS